MNGLYTAVATIGGGLGVFLLGMRHLSDGLQAASGERLRRFMSLATGHRAAGVATGVASTLVVQSSSIIIVMLVGFVTSGLMTLSQAVNVLIGANIGTTFTIWLMAFAPSPELLGLGLFIFGALAYFPLRTGRMRHVGLAVMGLGLVFLGMALMKNGVAPIKESPELSAQLRSLEATGLGSAALVALASALFTAVIQSSAASIMIFMTFASEGLVSVDTAIVALFGANIGTTATGWLAAIGQSRAAKRTALAHTASNVIGSVLLLPLALPVLAPLAKAAFPNCAATVPIAVADTTFALVRGLLLFPFVMPFSALLEKVLPDRADEKPHRSMLNANLAISPDIALEQAAKEVDFMAESIVSMLGNVEKALSNSDEEAAKRVVKREETLDEVQKDITVFVGDIMPRRFSSASADKARRLLRLADEYETASDDMRAVIRAQKRCGKLRGTDLAILMDVHNQAESLFNMRFAPADDRSSASRGLKEAIVSARSAQVMRMSVGDDTESVLSVLDMLNAYDRFRHCCATIGEIESGQVA